jgi:hypothetical protein
MRLQILHLAGCPNAAVLEARLAGLLGGHPNVEISRQLVEDDRQATVLGMAGSPTLLINGVDGFADPLSTPNLGCRLYRHDDGRLSGAPSVAQLRRALARADTPGGPSRLDTRLKGTDHGRHAHR